MPVSTPPLIPAFTALAVPSDPISSREIVYGESWKFDFNTGEFVLTPTGQVATTQGIDTLLQWVQKALVTKRFAYPIYPKFYGSDIESLIGVVVAQEAMATEVLRMIRETLLIDKRIKDISNMSATIQGDQLYATFTIVSYNQDIYTLTQGVTL